MIFFGLPYNYILQINAVFNQYPAINEVVLFGSRAKGNYRDNSDIDLAIKGEDINLSTLQEIETKLEELYIPNAIDLLVFDNIKNLDLINHINRVGKQFYSRGKPFLPVLL